MAMLNNRKEYLKRYLDGPKGSKSKKKKRKNECCHKKSRFKIVDEDIDMKKIDVSFKDDDESDEAPLIVNVIDERPEDVKVNEMYSCKSWKKLDNPVKVRSEKLTESFEQCSSSCHFSLVNNMEVKTRCNSEVDQPPLRRSDVKLPSGGLQKFPGNKSLPTIQHDSESDISPPRVKRIDTSDSDLSPPRNNDHHHKLGDYYPPRSKVNDHHYKDVSPPRSRIDNHHCRKRDFFHSRSKTDNWHPEQKNFFPPRSKAKNQDNKLRDFSPSRRKADKWHHKQKDFSPSKIKTYGHHDIQRDISPLRRNEKNCKNSDSIKKSNNQVLHSSDSDSSPLWKRTSSVNEKCNFYDGAQLEQIQTDHLDSCKPSQHSSLWQKQCSKRNKNRHDSAHDSDSHNDKEQNSTKKKSMSYSHNADTQSPVSKGKSYRMGEESLLKPRTSVDSGILKRHPMSTLSGMKAGLQDSTGLQEEIRNFKHREKVALDELGSEISGRNAETVSRDKDTGQKRNLKEERLKWKEKEKKNAEKLEKYLDWGKGLKQKDDQQKRLQEDMYEMSKPLARYVNDDDLERQLKDKLKEGDPMLEYMKKKRQKNQPAVTSSLQLYEGPLAPPNRFNVPPGYRWDGVDRSNGFEKRLFEKVNNTKATEHQAYLWSIENM